MPKLGVVVKLLAEVPMTVTLRPANQGDAEAAGRICYEAFKAIAEAHGFPPDFPSAEIAQGALAGMIAAPNVHGVVAEAGGRIIGSNFLDERGPIHGVGPITVDPSDQNSGVGARLMDAVLEHGRARGQAGIRLLQSGYHSRSLSLYSKLGYEVREHISCFQGQPIGAAKPGYPVRLATADDLEACDALCTDVHGHARSGEVASAIERGAAKVVEREGRITGYATPIAFFGHAAARTNDDLIALIAEAPAFPGPGFLVPSRNGEVMRWCLGHGLRMQYAMTLMTMGLYNEPAGAWLPSVLY